MRQTAETIKQTVLKRYAKAVNKLSMAGDEKCCSTANDTCRSPGQLKT